nr:hypothetical protein [uncultured Kingella sp.]
MIRRWLALTYYLTPCGSPPCLIFILIDYRWGFCQGFRLPEN